MWALVTTFCWDLHLSTDWTEREKERAQESTDSLITDKNEEKMIKWTMPHWMTEWEEEKRMKKEENSAWQL